MMIKCPYCESENVVIFFPNMPWFTHKHCIDCGLNSAASEAEINAELEARETSQDDPDAPEGWYDD